METQKGYGWILVVVIAVIAVVLVVAIFSQGSSPAASPAGPTPLPPDAIGITIVTNDTKAEWLGLVTEAFNKSAVKTSAGHHIIVQMIQESSPDPTVKKIVAGELQPTLWSPGDISWVEQANRLLKEQGKAPVVSEQCPRIVYAATGFAMWRPMAEALGWPDKPISWEDIVELAADPQGWAKLRSSRMGPVQVRAYASRLFQRPASTCSPRWPMRRRARPRG